MSKKRKRRNRQKTQPTGRNRHHLLHDVPKPPPEAMKPLYLAWKEQKGILDHFGIIEALEWLEKACDYEPFQMAIRKQRNFLEQKLGHN